MIEELTISGLGVIDDVRLALDPGLTVLTGETGAGKTMVMTGLGLLLGARADAALVRAEHPRTLVDGVVRVPPDGRVAQRVREAGGDVEPDGEVLLARSVGADGRSRAHVGGRAAPVSVLAELAAHLVAVHGQGDQTRLIRPAAQRIALDRFADDTVGEPLARYRAAYRDLAEAESTLAELTTSAQERLRESDLLRLGLDAIVAVDPQPGEDQALAAESERLTHADGLRTAAEEARAALAREVDGPGNDEPDTLALLGAARRALDAQRHHDPALADLAERLAELSYLAADLAGDLAAYVEDVDADPLRLAAVQERMAALRAMTRRYGSDVDEVLRWAKDAAARVADLDGDDGRIAALRQKRDELRATLAATGGEVSTARTQAAARLADLVGAELTALAMPQARVQVQVTPTASGPYGADEITFLLASHADAPARPLGAGASGGELSRVMLALEVVLAGADPVPTLVFDEVDAGIGGRAAIEVGRRLALLARSSQVVVVTHLPQVAAFADRHLVVAKSDGATITRAGLHALDDAGRVRELSRMLAGLEGSSTAAAHARELLDVAAQASGRAPAARRPAHPRTSGRAPAAR